VNAVLTRKQPSIEKLAKNKARGQNGHKVDYKPPTLSEELARQMRDRAKRIAGLHASELDPDDFDFLKAIAQSTPVIPADVARFAVLAERFEGPGANGHAVRGNGKARSETKPAKRETTAAAGETLGPVIEIPLHDLERHPANRHPSKVSIDERATSMADKGQLEPVIVRLIARAQFQSHYQIISGETRWLAAKQLKWSTIEARVRECNDAEALELVAEANGQRKDLNPIERAQLIEQLCKPVDHGGAGITKDTAAKRVGLNDGSSASNLVRLLKLPKIWQERVAAGELPESFARLIVPICHAPKLLDVLDETWKREKAGRQHQFATRWQDCGWDSRDQVQGLIDAIVKKYTRPLGKEKHNYRSDQFKIKGGDVWNYTGDHPRRFELTPEVEKTLDVVELTIGDKPVRLATDTKAYDALQIPAIVAHVNKNKSRVASKLGADKPATKRDLSPAERKKAEADKQRQLGERIQGWRHNLLLKLCAEAITAGKDSGLRIVLAFACEHPTGDKDFSAVLQDVRKLKGDPWDIELWDMVGPIEGKVEMALVSNLAVRILSLDSRDPRWPVLDFELIEAYAADLAVDVAKGWDALQDEHEDLRLHRYNDLAEAHRFVCFFKLFQSGQLDELGKELGVHVAEAKTRDAKVQLLTTRDRALKLPKCIKPLSVPGKRKAKRGK
jgi:ParB/RepB/Spo0J family partition protein